MMSSNQPAFDCLAATEPEIDEAESSCSECEEMLVPFDLSKQRWSEFSSVKKKKLECLWESIKFLESEISKRNEGDVVKLPSIESVMREAKE
mmetsp:Transcript_30276/g.68459  ORF Transcript_30276/g.68459 Transcript_30276/m.68459 type:complete len:92 (-) Transcript_30276:54-329(-)|eukprot:754595-Hanusia_phi.AAC.2